MKKILLVNDLVNGGGVEVVLKNLYIILKNNNYNVQVLINNKNTGDYIDKVYENNIMFLGTHCKYKIHKHAIHNLKYRLLYYFKYRKLSKVIKEHNPDLIIGFKQDSVKTLSYIKKRFNLNFNLIGSLHGSCKIEDNIKHYLKKQYKNVDYLTVLTEEDMEFYKQYTTNTVLVMPNPMKLNNITLKKEKIILCVSRVSSDKRVDLFVKAIRRIQDSLQNYRFAVVGSGNKLNDTVRLAEKLGVNIEFLGHLKEEDTYKYFAKSEIFVLSSEMEGFPCVLQEAMFFKCARISTRYIGGSLNTLISDGKDGLICELDEKDMAEKILLLASNDKLKHNFTEIAFNKFLELNKHTNEKWLSLIHNIVK